MPPTKKTDATDMEALLTLAVETIGEKFDRLVAPARKEGGASGDGEGRSGKRVPLAMIQLAKPLSAYAHYTTKHDAILHNSPKGLRLTLIDDAYVLVEGRAHEKDAKRQDKGVNLRLPLASGLVVYMEDLVPFKHRLDPAEHKALLQKAVDRTNHLAEVEPKEEAIQRAFTREPAPPVRVEAGTPPSKNDGITVGAGTNDEAELLADEMADERASLADD